jgi:hypothetical protein
MKVLTFNANGLLPNINELINFLTDLNVDVALIQETHLIPNKRIPRTHPYNVIRIDRRTSRQDSSVRGGGVAIFIHKRHTFSELTIPPLHSNIECVAAIIPLNGIPVAFVSLYQPPTVTRIDLDDLDTIFSIHPRVFVGGDYNARHTDLGCHTTTSRGNSLFQFLERSGLPISLHVPNCPTHYNMANSRATADILDIALSVNLPLHPLVDVIQDLSSDHLPVLFTFSNITHTRVNRSKVNWRRFNSHMEATLGAAPTALVTPVEIDRHVESLTETIQSALTASSTPPRLQRRSDLPPRIREALSEKRRRRRLWQLTRSPQHRSEFKAAAEHCSDLLRRHRSDRWEDFLSELEGHDSPWKACRTLLKENTKSSPIATETGLVFDEMEKVRAFGEYLTGHFTTPPRPEDEANLGTGHDQHIQLVVEQCLNSAGPPLPPFSREEVALSINKNNTKKAPGCDKITGFALLHSPPLLLDHILLIFNSIMLVQYFPAAWKESEICLILKPRKPPTQVTSYRPISLLPILSKLFERLLLSKIKVQLDSRLRPEQFGFRTEYSTTLQLMRFVSDISDAKNSSKALSAVLIDFQAAFDTVWHTGLLYKLSRIFQPSMLRLLKSYLLGRRFRVASRSPYRGKTLSDMYPITAGVPQGSVLGPILYLVYINDIPVQHNVNIGLYADDIVFYTTSKIYNTLKNRLQQQLNSFDSWTTKWRTKINPSKCEAITFPHNNRANPDPVSIGDHQLPWKTEVKYLGVTIDRRLSFGKHIAQKVVLGRVLLGKLYPILKSRAFNVKVKKLVFAMVIRAYLLYAAPVWFPFLGVTNRRKITGFHNRALRSVGNFHYMVPNVDAFAYLDTPPLLEFIQHTSRQLHDRSMTSSRPIIRELFSTPRPPPRKTAVPTRFGVG